MFIHRVALHARSACRVSIRGFSSGSTSAPKVNAFAVFAQPESFDVDLDTIEASFRSLQMKYHPDQNANSTEPLDAAEIEKKSSELNEAVRILRNPVLRAEHLMALKGSSPLQDESSRVDDPQLMFQLIEMQSDYEEGNAQEKEQILAQIRGQLKDLEPSFAQKYACGDLENATQVLTQMILLERFLQRMTGGAV